MTQIFAKIRNALADMDYAQRRVFEMQTGAQVTAHKTGRRSDQR